MFSSDFNEINKEYQQENNDNKDEKISNEEINKNLNIIVKFQTENDNLQHFTDCLQKENQILEKFYCQVCNLNLLSADQLKQHLSGKKHLKKLNQNFDRNTLFKCDLCKLNAISEKQLISHLSGKKHLKKLASIDPKISFKLNEKDGKLKPFIKYIFNCLFKFR